MTLPNNITAAVLAYHAAHIANLATFVEYDHAYMGLGEEPDGEAMAVVEDLGVKCDATYAARGVAQQALLYAIECMEVAK